MLRFALPLALVSVIFVTTADNDEYGRKLLELLGFPFRKPQESKETAGAAA